MWKSVELYRGGFFDVERDFLSIDIVELDFLIRITVWPLVLLYFI